MILDGYLTVAAHIEEVISLIKASKDKNEAKTALMAGYDLNEEQATAVLKLTLSRIASLEIQKFEDERTELLEEVKKLEELIANVSLIDEQIIADLRIFENKHKQPRRTVLLNKNLKEQKEKFFYFGSNGKVYSKEPNSGIIAVLPAGYQFMCITRNGIVLKSNKEPKRTSQLFKLASDDKIINVFIQTSGFLSFIDDDGHFRCKDIETLGKTKTTLSLKNIKEAKVSQHRISKTDFKSL